MKSDRPVIIASALTRARWLLVLLFGVLLPLYGFGWLTEAIWNRGGLDWDTPVLKWTHQHDSTGLEKILLFASQNGHVSMVLFFTVACAIVLLLWRRQKDERFLALGVVGAAAIVFLVKAAFYRVRPHFGAAPASGIDLGSPSTHSMGTFVLSLVLALIAWPTRWRWPVIVVGSLYAISVALSRIYLGAHQVSDVLAAWTLALAWVSSLSVFRSADLARKKKFNLLALGILASLAVVLAGYISSILKHDNLRVVVAGNAYRSGQMNAPQLARTIEHYGIKSILNLRGEDLEADWHHAEIQAAANLNVVHFDRSLSSGEELTLDQMDDLVARLRQTPKPVLIHCVGGADRSGLVSALYLLAVEGRSPREAEAELSLWNGHVPLVRPKVIAMDRSFRRYVSNRVSDMELNLPPGGFTVPSPFHRDSLDK
jgi:undecaprenyl-diphosphatase